MNSKIFLPPKNIIISENDVWRWYLNIRQELLLGFLQPDEQSYLLNYYTEAGLLRAWRRPFFRHHYSRTFAQTVGYLFSHKSTPRLLDLGCGTGSQALFLSLLGAEVFAIDMDDKALRILEKRKKFYEDKAGKCLNVHIYHSNIFEFNFELIAPVDGIHSMFAFNLMQPSTTLLDIIVRYIKDGSYFTILEGNNRSWKSKMTFSKRRRHRLSPQELQNELIKRSFIIIKHSAGVSIPPVFWCLIPHSILVPIDNFLGRFWVLAISHQLIAKWINQ